MRYGARPRTMIGMHFNSQHRCPDCGAKVWVPVTALSSHRGTTVRLVIREDEFRESFERHVMLNPQLHPTFVIADDDDVPDAGPASASNG